MRTTEHSVDAGRGRPHWARILANALLAAAAGAALLAGCSGSHRAAPISREARAIEVATFAVGGRGGSLLLPGRIRAGEEVTLTAKLAARLTSLAAREGARVRRGDAIARFEDPETRRALASARADASAAELAALIATRQAARMESLFAAQVVSARDREVAEAQQRAAQAQLESARATLERLDAGTTVRAPFDGVVVRLLADPGADLSPGAALAEVRSESGAELECEVPEHAVTRLERESLAMQVGEGAWRPVRLVRLAGMTDWRTRSRLARLAFDGSAEPGAFARLAIGGASDEGGESSVPKASLVARGALRGVYVVEGDRVHLRWLQLGREQGQRVEVLAGLTAGERYAVAPDSLREGDAVTIQP